MDLIPFFSTLFLGSRPGRARACRGPPAGRAGIVPDRFGAGGSPVSLVSRQLPDLGIRLRAVPVAPTDRRSGPIDGTSRDDSLSSTGPIHSNGDGNGSARGRQG